MTSLRPGHSPPHVTMPQASVDGSKKICSRGPRELHRRRIAARALEAAQLLQRRRIEHALVVANEADTAHRRRHTAVTEARDGEIGTAVGGQRTGLRASS